jgi:hypothetical protein
VRYAEFGTFSRKVETADGTSIHLVLFIILVYLEEQEAGLQSCSLFFHVVYKYLVRLDCRSQWPRSLRHELSLLAQTLGSWVEIPQGMDVSACLFCVFVVLCVGSGLATS